MGAGEHRARGKALPNGRRSPRQDWPAYLYIAPALGLALLFSFFSMGVSFWASLHDWDPFVGSGTVAIVAQQFGRRFVGIDCSEDYCTLAKKRLEKSQLAFGLV